MESRASFSDSGPALGTSPASSFLKTIARARTTMMRLRQVTTAVPKTPARKNKSPSSANSSRRPLVFRVFVPRAQELAHVEVTLSWAQYDVEFVKPEGQPGRGLKHWRRVPYGPVTVSVPLDQAALREGIALPDVVGVRLTGRLAPIHHCDRVGVPRGHPRALTLLGEPPAGSREPRRAHAVSGPDAASHRDTPRAFARTDAASARSKTSTPASPSSSTATRSSSPSATTLRSFQSKNAEIDKDGQVRAVATRWIPKAEVQLVDAAPRRRRGQYGAPRPARRRHRGSRRPREAPRSLSSLDRRNLVRCPSTPKARKETQDRTDARRRARSQANL